jgi:CDP-diacylglycerol--serine O-phosphatidyltransferase
MFGEERQPRLRMLTPLRRRNDRRPRRFRRGVYLLPSMFTMGNMFCGYACVVYSMRGDFALAAPLIGVAIVLDMLDGRVARMTGATSEFGLEFD